MSDTIKRHERGSVNAYGDEARTCIQYFLISFPYTRFWIQSTYIDTVPVLYVLSVHYIILFHLGEPTISFIVTRLLKNHCLNTTSTSATLANLQVSKTVLVTMRQFVCQSLLWLHPAGSDGPGRVAGMQ